MKRAIVLCVLYACALNLAAQSNLPAHLVWRMRVSQDGAGTTWRDQMSDGTFRESTVPWPETPVSVNLVETNDAGQAWRLDYRATYVNGTNVAVRTNFTFVLKPREERMKPARPPLPALIPWSDRAASVASNRPHNAFAQIAARRSGVHAPASRTNLMARPLRALAQHVDGDALVSRMTDGSVVTSSLRRVTTARVASANPHPASDNGGGMPIVGAAGMAAAAFVAGIAAGRASKKTGS